MHDSVPSHNPGVTPAIAAICVDIGGTFTDIVFLTSGRSAARSPTPGTGRVESIAVCFLHAYANPQHEQMVGDLAYNREILRESGTTERQKERVMADDTICIGTVGQGLWQSPDGRG
jgi:hypothetical protein